jgi:putative hydrolase of the HAD superfamily
MAGEHIRALVLDFGGVLTTSIWPAFGAFCEEEGLAPETVRDLFRGDAEAIRLLRGLETGELPEPEFETGFAKLLGLADASGVKTGLISNSWGLGIYERAPIDLFDITVISAEVGLHKPQPEIYRLACERLEVEPAEAVFVDDLRENCEGAEAVGMTAVLHRETPQTVARLEQLLGIDGLAGRRSSRGGG